MVTVRRVAPLAWLAAFITASVLACAPQIAPATAVVDPDSKGRTPEEHAAAQRANQAELGAEYPADHDHDGAEHLLESSPPAGLDSLHVDPPHGATPNDEGGSAARSDKPWMGIEMRHTEHDGVIVEGVFPGSPAASAGLQSGDQLLVVGDQAIARPVDVVVAVQALSVGQSVTVKMMRAGQPRFARLVLVPKPDSEDLMRSLYVGRPAPSISTLKTVQGSVVPSFEQLRGKPVVLEFWATWCVACRALAPTLNRWHDELSPMGVRVMAVTAEAYEDVALALPQLDMRYSVFVDATGEVIMGYRASALPTVFLVDGTGVVRDVMVGFDPRQLEGFRQKLGELARAGSKP